MGGALLGAAVGGVPGAVVGGIGGAIIGLIVGGLLGRGLAHLILYLVDKIKEVRLEIGNWACGRFIT